MAYKYIYPPLGTIPNAGRTHAVGTDRQVPDHVRIRGPRAAGPVP